MYYNISPDVIKLHLGKKKTRIAWGSLRFLNTWKYCTVFGIPREGTLDCWLVSYAFGMNKYFVFSMEFGWTPTDLPSVQCKCCWLLWSSSWCWSLLLQVLSVQISGSFAGGFLKCLGLELGSLGLRGATWGCSSGSLPSSGIVWAWRGTAPCSSSAGCCQRNTAWSHKGCVL